VIAIPVTVQGRLRHLATGRDGGHRYAVGPFELRSRTRLQRGVPVIATPFYGPDGLLAGMDLYPHDGEAEAVLEVHNSGLYTLPLNRVAQVVAVRDRHTLVVHAPYPERTVVVPPTSVTRHAIVRYRQRVLGTRGTLSAAEEELRRVMTNATLAPPALAQQMHLKPPAESLWVANNGSAKIGLFVDGVGNVVTIVHLR